MKKILAKKLRRGNIVELYGGDIPPYCKKDCLAAIVGGPIELSSLRSSTLDGKVLVFELFTQDRKVMYVIHKDIVRKLDGSEEIVAQQEIGWSSI